jgi:hypothetical protein
MNLLVQFAGGKDYLVGVYIFLGLGPWHNRYPSGTSPLGASSPMSFKLFPASRRYRDGMDSCRRARRRVDPGIVLFFATCRHRGRHCCRHLLPPSLPLSLAAATVCEYIFSPERARLAEPLAGKQPSHD